jgi:predicted nucleic acid-binding protein
MDLIDTNVWMQPLFHQPFEAQARAYFEAMSDADLAITDFARHSIGIECDRRDRMADFTRWTHDILIGRNVTIVTIPPALTPELVLLQAKLRLDYDDAYQALAAIRTDRRLVTLDSRLLRAVPGAVRPLRAVHD